MSRDNSFHDYIMNEVFQGVEGLSSRSMFGGFGIYKEGVFFALISDGELFFKVGDNNKADYNKKIANHLFTPGTKERMLLCLTGYYRKKLWKIKTN